MILIGDNVNDVWPQALRLLMDEGLQRNSRNGPVRELSGPLMTTYYRPQERVLFDSVRDANPFFHLFEALWILAGRDDVAFPAQFASQLKAYSDNGETFHGAYGYRLRAGSDQLRKAEDMLRTDPDSRRVVLSLWDAPLDLGKESRDVPCNTHIYVKITDGLLRLTVCNRSNDIVWGLYGANVVQFSMIQEYLAGKLGVPMGPMTTLSDSFHAYADNVTWKLYADGEPIPCHDPYAARLVAPWPLMDHPESFDDDLRRFLADPLAELGPMFPKAKPTRNSFFWMVAEPMYRAWVAHKSNKNGLDILQGAQHEEDQRIETDWLAAGKAWLERRERPAGHHRRPAGAAESLSGKGRRSPHPRAQEVRR